MTASRTRGRQTVTLTPAEGQSEADIERDFAASFAHGERMTERGVNEYRSVIRRIGPVKVLAAKEVGPPPWRWPRLVGAIKRRPTFASVGIGWRSTLYSCHVMWSRGVVTGQSATDKETRP